MAIEKSIVIARPVEEVYEAFVNFEKTMPQTDPDIESVEKTSEGPFGVGTTFRVRQKLFGKTRESTNTVTAAEPGRLFEMESRVGPINPKASFTFEPAEGGTRVTFRGDPRPRGLAKLFSGRINKVGEALWDKRLAGLKRAIET